MNASQEKYLVYAIERQLSDILIDLYDPTHWDHMWEELEENLELTQEEAMDGVALDMIGQVIDQCEVKVTLK